MPEHGIDAPIDLDSLDRNLKIMLVRRVDELGLSERLFNCLRTLHCEYVGDVVSFTSSRLLRQKNFGRKSLSELHKKLDDMGLHLGASIRGWTWETAKDLRYELEDEVRESLANDFLMQCGSKKSLEDELNAIAKTVASNRNVEIITKFWGWAGGGERTLESVGQEYGITRERVRQIAAKAWKKLNKIPLPCPKLKEATVYMLEQAPTFENILAANLVSAGITASPFKISGIISAANILKVDRLVYLAEVENLYFVIPKDVPIKVIIRFIRLVKALSRPHGCVNFDELMDQLEIERDSERQFFTILVDRHEDFRWLDQNRKWMWDVSSNKRGRNRVVNFMRKIFSITSSVHISELRQGIGRSHRILFAPPSPVLMELCHQLDFLKVKGNMVETSSGVRLPSTLSLLESTLIQAFHQEPILARDFLEANAIALGMNRSSFYVMIGYSVVVTRLAKGVYAPIGSEIPPGAVEAIKPSYVKGKRIVDFGWNAGRYLWVAYYLTDSMLRESLANVPTSVKEFLQGKWNMVSPGQKYTAFISIDDTRVMGLQTLLDRRGAEPSDALILVFDTRDHVFRMELGSDELVERWQNNDVELTAEQLLDIDPVDKS